MDILFSPYGVGCLPKSAMAEVQQRTEELLTSSSFQRMLELEKKYKMERLRGTQQLLPPPSRSSTEQKDGPPPRPPRPDHLSQEQNYLMLRIAQRSVIVPSLSITIPPATDYDKGDHFSDGEEEQQGEKHAGLGTPTNSEVLHKQVKFLAPEDGQDQEVDEDEEEDEAMSEQSSICQSPSWEGYGQRKKEKKLEAERRKREKERTEKEAKAAKKRNTTRLSKPPPPPPPRTASYDPRPSGITNADRSMSDPLLTNQHLLEASQAIHRPEDVGRAASADDLQQNWRHRHAVPEVLSGPRSKMEPSGSGKKLNGETEKTFRAQAIPPSFACRPEVRSFRDARPPSASRTPMLTNGARREGYVHYQRAQSQERAMAALADEQLVGNLGQVYPPRSSSQQDQEPRRLSLTQEAKFAAMKLVGMRGTPAVSDDIVKSTSSSTQNDYFTFKAVPYSASGSEITPSMGNMPTLPRSRDGPTTQTHVDSHPLAAVAASSHNTRGLDENALFRPPTSQNSASSSDPSVAGPFSSHNSKKARNMKGAAMAALSMSKSSRDQPEVSKKSVSAPPYLKLRALMHSRAQTHAEGGKVQLATDRAPEGFSSPMVTPAVPDPVKTTETRAPEGCRASEASSSSSAFEDGSALPSPATTPDTSRPQSAKDIPLAASEPRKDLPQRSGLQDDERTLRASLDSSKSSTPRLVDAEVREGVEMDDQDRWSRTALPIDIDADPQSPTTSEPNIGSLDAADQWLPNYPPASPKTTQQPICETFPTAVQHPQPRKPFENHGLSRSNTDTVLMVPPRSKKRGHAKPNGPMGSPKEASSPIVQAGGDIENTYEGLGVAGEGDRLAQTPTVWPGVDGDDRHIDERLGCSRSLSDSAVSLEQVNVKMKEVKEEKHKRQYHQRQTESRKPDIEAESEWAGRRDEVQQTSDGHMHRNWTSGSISSTSSNVLSSGPRSPADFQLPSNPYLAEFSEPAKDQATFPEISTSAGSPSPLASPVSRAASNPSPQPRMQSSATSSPRASTPAGRHGGIVPVSILKQPKNATVEPAATTPKAPVLSAIPKHMQLQAGLSVRPPAAAAETRMAPIAKMFVECCNCKFYHDMPSKIYECMAKPDAVVEDRALGISGAITTMVKCPWCHHNMSRNCCAGYAAVVYLKEKLH